MQMVIFIKVNGKMEWLMVKALFVTLKEVFMMEIGKKTSSTVKVLNFGIITKLSTRVTSMMDKKLEWVPSSVMEVNTKVNSSMVCSMVRESISSPIQEKSIKDSLKKINLVVLVKCYGQIKVNTSANSKMV